MLLPTSEGVGLDHAISPVQHPQSFCSFAQQPRSVVGYGSYELSSNPFYFAEILELARDVFTTIIAPKSLHLLPQLTPSQPVLSIHRTLNMPHSSST